MRLNFLVLLTIVSILFFQDIAFSDVSKEPLKTAIIYLPIENSDWKEIARRVNENEGFVERIPIDQTTTNWTELIGIQYLDVKHWDMENIEYIMEAIEAQTISDYPGNKVTWNIIEKNKDDIIYEWILHKPYKNIPNQHEVARAFLINGIFHRVGFTRKNAEMSANERNTWIKLLKKSSVIPFEEAANSNGFSLAKRKEIKKITIIRYP